MFDVTRYASRTINELFCNSSLPIEKSAVVGRVAATVGQRILGWARSLVPRFSDDAFRAGTSVARTSARSIPKNLSGQARHYAHTAAAGAWHGLSRGALGPTFATAKRFTGRAPTAAEQWLFSGARGAGDWVRQHPDLTAFGAMMAGAETPANLYFFGRYPVTSTAFALGGGLGGGGSPAAQAAPTHEGTSDELAALLANWPAQAAYSETPDYYGQLFGV